MQEIRWRLILIAVVIAISIIGLYPIQEKIHLGLDLRGGMHLDLKIHMDDALRATRDNTLNSLRSWLLDKKILHYFLLTTPDNITIEIQPVQGFERKTIVQAIDKLMSELNKTWKNEWNIERLGDIIRLKMKQELINTVYRRTTEQAVFTIKKRVDEYGLAEVVVAPHGAKQDRILVQLPGVEDPAQVRQLIKKTAFLEFRLVRDSAASREILLQKYQNNLPPNTEILEGRLYQEGGEPRITYYLVDKNAVVTGQDLEYAAPTQDRFGKPAVSFRLSAKGGKRFFEFTGKHINEPLAIVLDKVIISAPVIRAQIGSEGIIEGLESSKEAETLAIQLRSGALPAKLTVLEERQVGPSLGRDSIRKGMISAISGLIIVMIFMLFYYKLGGINADIALALNILLVFAGLAYFGATLTLPGIAGIVLTIGMAVDANVLVFERIKEELRMGKSVRSAIDHGFSRAFTTILDANLTTLLAAIALYVWGTGPVRGFAITLSLGILSSMFTAVFVSRTLFDMYLQIRPIKKLHI